MQAKGPGAPGDWPQILTLYEQLLSVAPTSVVALDRAVAVGEVRGPAAALSHTVQIEQEVNHFGIWARADHCWHCIRRSSG